MEYGDTPLCCIAFRKSVKTLHKGLSLDCMSIWMNSMLGMTKMMRNDEGGNGRVRDGGGIWRYPAVLYCFPRKVGDFAKRSRLGLHEHMDETACF